MKQGCTSTYSRMVGRTEVDLFACAAADKAAFTSVPGAGFGNTVSISLEVTTPVPMRSLPARAGDCNFTRSTPLPPVSRREELDGPSTLSEESLLLSLSAAPDHTSFSSSSEMRERSTACLCARLLRRVEAVTIAALAMGGRPADETFPGLTLLREAFTLADESWDRRGGSGVGGRTILGSVASLRQHKRT